MASVIFICTGNMCRSPMAEAMLKKKTQTPDLPDIAVSSMGIHAQDGAHASSNASLVCRENGIDLSNHRSRALVPEELMQADLIFVMEPVHREFLRLFFPKVSHKTFLLGAWPHPETKKSSIKDPVGRPLKEYVKARDLIGFHIERVFNDLLRHLSQCQNSAEQTSQ